MIPARPRRRRAAAIAIVVLAAIAAVVPMPRAVIERWYSERAFAAIQRGVTPVSNLLPIALFDLLILAAFCVFAVAMYRCVHRHGWLRGCAALAGRTAVVASAVYLVFLVTWGLNYRRVPLIEKLDYDTSRITAASMRAFSETTIEALNDNYSAAHAAPLSLDGLARAFHETQHRLGSQWSIVPARPKATLLGGYFHQTSISGMTDPFFLETLLAPDLLPVERPFVIAHEWAHLAGYADESEANYVAWLTCRHGDAAARYSGALGVIGYVRPSRSLRTALEVGPRIDLFAIARRYEETSPVLRTAARQSYDTYLKANRVEKGVESYDLVVQLILGTRPADGYPVRR